MSKVMFGLREGFIISQVNSIGVGVFSMPDIPMILGCCIVYDRFDIPLVHHIYLEENFLWHQNTLYAMFPFVCSSLQPLI